MMDELDPIQDPMITENEDGSADVEIPDDLADIEEMRYKVVDKSDTALQNIIDEIVALYLSTIYKLKFLA